MTDIHRGPVVTSLASILNIDLEDTNWMEEKRIRLEPGDSFWLVPLVTLLNNEFTAWVLIASVLIFLV